MQEPSIKEILREGNLSEGWGVPVASNKRHYFRATRLTSLCGKWLNTCNFPLERKCDPDDCPTCRERKAALDDSKNSKGDRLGECSP